MSNRRGFAMLTVLWIVVVASAIALVGSVAGHDAAAAHKNRINATRARWRAHSCADRVRHTVDLVLSETVAAARDSVWRALDSAVVATGLLADGGCVARLVAAGSQLNVNVATATALERLFESLGLAAPSQIAAATMDWIDADDTPRDGGAEAVTYSALARRGPRNGPVASVEELRYVIGLEAIGLDSVLTADSVRVSLNNAPLPVLAALPGFGTEVLARIAEWRAIGRQITNVLVLAESVSPTAEAAIINSFPELARGSTIDPEAWYVHASAQAGYPAVTATTELRLIRTQTRAVRMRRRVW
jgi:type II secretory pathway component PulK